MVCCLQQWGKNVKLLYFHTRGGRVFKLAFYHFYPYLQCHYSVPQRLDRDYNDGFLIHYGGMRTGVVQNLYNELYPLKSAQSPHQNWHGHKQSQHQENQAVCRQHEHL